MSFGSRTERYSTYLRRAKYVNVLCSRQMGKTSLIFRTRKELIKVGVRTAYINVDAQLGTPSSAPRNGISASFNLLPRSWV